MHGLGWTSRLWNGATSGLPHRQIPRPATARVTAVDSTGGEMQKAMDCQTCNFQHSGPAANPRSETVVLPARIQFQSTRYTLLYPHLRPKPRRRPTALLNKTCYRYGVFSRLPQVGGKHAYPRVGPRLAVHCSVPPRIPARLTPDLHPDHPVTSQ